MISSDILVHLSFLREITRLLEGHWFSVVGCFRDSRPEVVDDDADGWIQQLCENHTVSLFKSQRSPSSVDHLMMGCVFRSNPLDYRRLRLLRAGPSPSLILAVVLPP